MKKVLTSLDEAARFVRDGDLVTTGGATFHRAPMEFVRELVRQGKKNLSLVDREPAMDFDLLVAPDVAETPAPSKEIIDLIHNIDPDGVRWTEFR